MFLPSLEKMGGRNNFEADEVELGESMGDPGSFIIVRLGSGYEDELHFRDLGGRMNKTINQPLADETLKFGCSNLSPLKCWGNSWGQGLQPGILSMSTWLLYCNLLPATMTVTIANTEKEVTVYQAFF